MIDTFYGRKRERELLNQQFSRSSSLVVLYGRRRVGKTRLVVESLHAHPSIYFAATEAPAHIHHQRFLQLMAEYFKDPVLEQVAVHTWAEIFEILEQRRSGQTIIVALDEFQWAVQADPELPSVLQHFWDQRWQNKGVHLILCGSYLGFMERELLGGRQPLFGRRTAQLQLQPFKVAEVSAQFPHLSPRHLLSIYLILGGIPTYLNELDPTESLRQSLVRLMLDDNAPLREEPLFLLREELSDFRYHNAILAAIASGTTVAGDIARAAGVPETRLRYYLDPLMALGYVVREISIEKRHLPASKKSRYRMADPLLRFWFRFVFPNSSVLAQSGAATVYDRRIAPQLDSFLGCAFEDLVREVLPGWLLRRHNVLCDAVGRFWSKQCEIDAAVIRDDGLTHIVEVRWKHEPITEGAVNELRKKISCYPNPEGHTILPMFVSMEGYGEGLRSRPEVICVPMEELFDITAEI